MPVSMQHVKHNAAINWRTDAMPDEIDEAVKMWSDGFSTFEIAQSLGIYEAVLYNNLPKWRGGP